MRTYKLLQTSIASVFANLYVPIISRGRIVAVDWSCYMNGAAATNSGMIWELSLASNLQALVHDGLNIISYATAYVEFRTAAATMSDQVNKFCTIPSPGIPVETGDRIWINTQILTAAPLNANACVVVYVA